MPCWHNCFVNSGPERNPGSFTAFTASLTQRRVSATETLRQRGPGRGLTDVHRYLLITLVGGNVTIDITFPGDPAWDGNRSMGLAYGDGRDYPAGEDPDADKAALEASCCDPLAREPFIAALTLASARTGPTARDPRHVSARD
jgi:hypothetical protein